MSLNLDARQRAMLAEMGVKVWQPEPVSASAVASVMPAPAQVPARASPLKRPETIAISDRLSLASNENDALKLPSGIEAMDWPALQAAVATCQACSLCRGRTNTVFGAGDVQADWMVVGEAPGEQEDRQGEPFVGPSGQLLDNMLKAVGLSRRATAPVAAGVEPGPARASAPAPSQPLGVYIANVVKCRPPGNRNPQPAEVAQCESFLLRQIALVRPKIILAMGRFAVQSLLRTTEPIGRLRGQVHQFQGVPVVVTFHPAYLLRSLPEKARAWADLCLALDVVQGKSPPAGES